MNYYEIVVLGIGLSMDAFAVAVCKGLAMDKVTLKKSTIVGLWFGFFQALMPLIGFFIMSLFRNYVEAVDHWIAFALLSLIGVNMIKESLSCEENTTGCSLTFKVMFIMAIATSIDALVSGAAFGDVSNIKALIACLIIGVTTFTLSAIGVKIGSVFGAKYKSKAEFFGGAILILLGVKVLLEDLNILSF